MSKTKTIRLEVHIVIEIDSERDARAFLEGMTRVVSECGEGVMQIGIADDAEAKQTHAAPTTLQ